MSWFNINFTDISTHASCFVYRLSVFWVPFRYRRESNFSANCCFFRNTLLPEIMMLLFTITPISPIFWRLYIHLYNAMVSAPFLRNVPISYTKLMCGILDNRHCSDADNLNDNVNLTCIIMDLAIACKHVHKITRQTHTNTLPLHLAAHAHYIIIIGIIHTTKQMIQFVRLEVVILLQYHYWMDA